MICWRLASILVENDSVDWKLATIADFESLKRSDISVSSASKLLTGGFYGVIVGFSRVKEGRGAPIIEVLVVDFFGIFISLRSIYLLAFSSFSRADCRTWTLFTAESAFSRYILRSSTSFIIFPLTKGSGFLTKVI